MNTPRESSRALAFFLEISSFSETNWIMVVPSSVLATVNFVVFMAGERYKNKCQVASGKWIIGSGKSSQKETKVIKGLI
jgi:hypothetical protein